MINSVVNKIRPFAKSILSPGLRTYVNRVYFFFSGIVYSGDRVFCYCCSRSFSKFLPYGTYGKPVRENAQCPGCGSLERHRLIMAYLRKESPLFSVPNRLLHFAPEDILQQIFKKEKNISYLSVDLFSPIAMVKMDIMDLQLEAESFDVILCNHVLAHVDSDLKAMSELYRVLSPKGWMIITTTVDFSKPTYEVEGPLTPLQKVEIYGQEDLCRIYGYDIMDRLKSNRLETQKINYASNFSQTEREKYGFNNETILLCKKATW